MVSLRFSSFLFGLSVSISLHSFAFSHKDMEEKQVMIVAANTRSPNLSQPNEILNEVPTRAEAGIEEVGRKMMKMRRVLKMMNKEILKETERTNIVKTVISGETSDNLKMKKRSNKQMLDCNLSDKSTSNAWHRRRMKVRMASFEAINADYKAPMPHPPRNN